MVTFWGFLEGAFWAILVIVIVLVGFLIACVLCIILYEIFLIVKYMPKVKVLEEEKLQESVWAGDRSLLTLLLSMGDSDALEFKNKQRDRRIKFIVYELFDKGFSPLQNPWNTSLRGFRDYSDEKCLYFTLTETLTDDVLTDDFIKHRKDSSEYQMSGVDAYNYLNTKKWWLLELSPEGDKFRITRTVLPA